MLMVNTTPILHHLARLVLMDTFPMPAQSNAAYVLRVNTPHPVHLLAVLVGLVYMPAKVPLLAAFAPLGFPLPVVHRIALYVL